MDHCIKTTTLLSKTPFPTSTTPQHSKATAPSRQAHPTITTTTTLSLTVPSTNNPDQELLTALRQRNTEQAWEAYTKSPHLPGSTCLSRLVSQLSYQRTPSSLSRAQSILRRLRDENQLRRLDCNSLGLLAAAAAKSGQTDYANAIIKSMLRSGYFPHVKAWSAVVSRLACSDDHAGNALRLFACVVRRLDEIAADAALFAADMRPDTGAFNAVLNACANSAEPIKFFNLFQQMGRFDAKPDVLTFNILIKLCARIERKDLLGLVLEKGLDQKLVPCITTFHSLVAAFVGLGDLDTAEKLVQAMREGRTDICRLLRNQNPFQNQIPIQNQNPNQNHSIVQQLVGEPLLEPPLLPKSYYPNSRIYTTLMKGYIQQGRVRDVVDMLKAMKKLKDQVSQPDHVTYTTVISAFVNIGSMEEAHQFLAEMASMGVPANRVTYNVMLKGYCRLLQMEKAQQLALEMQDNGIELDVVSYNILINGRITVDDSAGALSYFNEMRSKGIAPTKISYTTLMKAFALCGQPKLASKVFDEMLNDPRVKVDVVAWNMLIEGYCRLGLVEEAKKILERMKENGLYPDVATYGSLANGIALARKPGEALLLWKEVKERCYGGEGGAVVGPALKPDEGLLGTLADVCVRAAFFKKALEIVACMEENGISPDKTKYKRIYVEMHSRMFTSKHASKARQDRRRERKRAAEAFKFWLGLPNSYYGSEWRLEPSEEDGGGYVLE